MKIETALSCGDPGWIYQDGNYVKLTVGQVRTEFTTETETEDDDDEEVFKGNVLNRVKRTKYKETYMCIESGVGSGSIWEYGRDIFKTREDCVLGSVEKEKARLLSIENSREIESERLRSQHQYLLSELKLVEDARLKNQLSRKKS